VPPEVSIVVPVYGCAQTLRALHERITAATRVLPGTHELILVDDCGPDDAWKVIEELASEDPAVTGVRLSRNFGQHAAITAGLTQSTGAWVVVMDCDLQEPPELIPDLYARAHEGYDIVFARRHRKSESWSRALTSRVYYRALNTFAGTSLDGAYGAFSIASRKVIESVLRFRDRDRQYLLMLSWLGYRHTSVDYEHQPRAAGESSYDLRSLLRIATDGMFFQTTKLLRWIVMLGFAFAALGGLLAVGFVIAKLTRTTYPGWTSLAFFMLTVGGFIIISTGITGLYIGKVFEQVKGRPLFVIDEVAGAPLPTPSERTAVP